MTICKRLRLFQSGCVCMLLLALSCLIDTSSAEYNCEYKKDGFYRDEDFCHIYWRCNYGVAEEYECPAGTAWNHVESRCDWLDNVDCTRTDDNKKEASKDTEDSDNNDAAVESTKKAKKSKQKTTQSDDNTVDDEAETTPHVSKYEAKRKLKALLRSRSVVTNSPAVSPSSEASLNESVSSINSVEELEVASNDYDELCDNLTLSTSFREDPFICNKYVRCNHGFAQKFNCAKDTAWDVERRMCLWTQFVECGERRLITDEKLLGNNDSDDFMKKNVSRTTRSTTTTSETTSLKTTLSKTSNNSQATDKPDSVVVTSNPGGSGNAAALCQSFGSYYVPDASSCASYYMCNNGKESKLTCPEKQLFNTDSTQCEDFQQVFCGTRAVNMADRNQCASKRDGIFTDIDRSCRVFYQCINQQKVREANCPNALKFNTLTGRCDNPANVLPPCGTYSVSAGVSYLSLPAGFTTFLAGCAGLFSKMIAERKLIC